MSRAIHWAVLGNPENRRVSFFREAAEALGRNVEVFSWMEFLENPGRVFDGLSRAHLVRLDSVGENADLQRVMILSMLPGARDLKYGEIGYQSQVHQAFCEMLQPLEGYPCMNAPKDIAVMFDKWRCHELLVEAGVPRPVSTLAPGTIGELRERMRSKVRGRWFLKPLHGSSGSGVCALRWEGDREQLKAPLVLELEGNRPSLFNNLRIRTYEDPEVIDAILGELLPEGMICEQWLPKVTLRGGSVDLRIVVIAGRARHAVVRQSREPMTNLHLGNQRVAVEEFIVEYGEERWEEARKVAESAASVFSDSLVVGVDLLVTAQRVAIGELNAFGDLLPGLRHEGETTYEAIVRAALERERIAA